MTADPSPDAEPGAVMPDIEHPSTPSVDDRLAAVTAERDAALATLKRVAVISREMVSKNRHPQHGPAEFGSRLKTILAADGTELLKRRDALTRADELLEASADLLTEMAPSKKVRVVAEWLDDRAGRARAEALR